ncbi:MAG: hypothetical protein IKB95_03965 [Bacteroidales bacterium]|nr:hypothetical protein [Bacteroidales bacterium]
MFFTFILGVSEETANILSPKKKQTPITIIGKNPMIFDQSKTNSYKTISNISPPYRIHYSTDSLDCKATEILIGRNVWYVGCNCKIRTSVLRRAGGYRRYAKRKTLETAVAISEVLIPNSRRKKKTDTKMVSASFFGTSRRKRYQG